jgi:hypothetical protein
MADSVTFRFSGGETFMADLGHWRDRLRAEVHAAAIDDAERIASVTIAALPWKTGNLRQHVKTKDESAGDSVLVRVRSLARHSHLYERGTKPRRTARGWDRGVMPATPIFVPTAIARRANFQARVRRIMGSPEPALGTGSPTVTGSL